MLFRKITTVPTYGDRYPDGLTLFECSDCGALVTVDGQGKHSAFHLSLLGGVPSVEEAFAQLRKATIALAMTEHGADDTPALARYDAALEAYNTAKRR